MSADPEPPSSIAPAVTQLAAELWRDCCAEAPGFTYDSFEALLFEIGQASNWGIRETEVASSDQQIAFLRSLRLKELLLARACASGNEAAWERFLIDYREILYSAAYSITKQDGLGRELADSLYAELYGISTREGVRRSKLLLYSGRGSLAGWLRSVLAQRFVDEYRCAKRMSSLEDQESELAATLPETSTLVSASLLGNVAEGIQQVLGSLEAEDRFLLHAYYLDQRTLAQIGKALGMHESTASRRLKSLMAGLQKRLLKQLQSSGLSRRAAEEALDIDVRDLEVDVRKFLQASNETSFQPSKAATRESL